MKRMLLAIAAMAALAGCADTPEFMQEPEAVTRSSYTPTGPASLTLITVRNNASGAGGHTALLISGPEQVIFDPAGSFRHPEIERRGDVLVGIDPGFWQGYKSMHARASHNVQTQTVQVSPAVAARALELAYARGPVAQARCARSTSTILKQLPGFENIEVTYFPVNLSEQFAAITGDRGEAYYENFVPVELRGTGQVDPKAGYTLPVGG